MPQPVDTPPSPFYGTSTKVYSRWHTRGDIALELALFVAPVLVAAALGWAMIHVRRWVCAAVVVVPAAAWLALWVRDIPPRRRALDESIAIDRDHRRIGLLGFRDLPHPDAEEHGYSWYFYPRIRRLWSEHRGHMPSIVHFDIEPAEGDPVHIATTDDFRQGYLYESIRSELGFAGDYRDLRFKKTRQE